MGTEQAAREVLGMKQFERMVIPAIGIVAVLVGVGAWRAGLFETRAPATDPAMAFIGATPTDEVRLRDVLVLSGFVERQERHVAIINDNVVEQGEEMQIVAGEHSYKLRVETITLDRVVLRVLEGPP